MNLILISLGNSDPMIDMVTISNKVFFQTSLEKNLSNLLYIFILSVKFENLTIGLHVLILSFILAKFQEYQRSIAISSNKC